MSLEITPTLLALLIARLFADDDQPAATRMLAEHAAHANHPEVPRVQVATLKLSNGSLDKLREAIGSANLDYRDVLAWAEYPAQMQAPVTGLSKEQTRSLISADHLQFDAWLRLHADGAT